MRITERLNVEHGVFLVLLEQVDRLLDDGNQADARVVAQAVIAALEPHCQLEDRVLYPALAKIAGADLPALRKTEEDHRWLAQISDTIRFGELRPGVIEDFVAFLRDHIEREIHLIGPLIEEIIPEKQLTALCDWHGDHVRERATRAVRMR